ncbi:MAG: pyruvate kinase [Gammaproteobacteria bacterium]|nr:pyruvate kinase [Gammaproteobacteria bacterium]
MHGPERRTRIICTIGPASAAPERIRALISAGMDVARLNFSHGSHDFHGTLVRDLRAAAEEQDHPLAILQDLQGPKIRVENVPDAGIELVPNSMIDLTGSGSAAVADATVPLIAVSYPAFHRDVRAGTRVLLDDGQLHLVVEDVIDARARCRVLDGGRLLPRKGVNLPGVLLTVPALTDKDIADLRFGVAQGVDYIALSFVQRAEDVQQAKALIREAGGDIPVIAKIEKPQAVTGIDAILEVADGIMIARGDLGVELPPEEVPRIQKALIRSAVRRGVPVITATQMLESMIKAPRPTRAEASDVANAVLDSTDAVMLSGETASGDHPIAAAQMMARIITLTEQDLEPRWDLLRRDRDTRYPVDLAVGYSACHAAEMIRADAIVCLTGSGATARTVARFRPLTPILALTSSDRTRRRLSLIWGVKAVPTRDFGDDLEAAVAAIISHLTERQSVKPGDRLVLTAGIPFGDRRTTNTMRIEEIPSNPPGTNGAN